MIGYLFFYIFFNAMRSTHNTFAIDVERDRRIGQAGGQEYQELRGD